MRIERHFTTAGQDPYDGVRFASRDSRIVNPDGSAVFEAAGVTVPAEWSQVAADIMAQKYFRKTGVAADLEAIEEDGVPEWLWRSSPASGDAGDEDAFGGKRTHARSSTASPAPGPTGAGSTATSTARPTPVPSTTSSST